MYIFVVLQALHLQRHRQLRKQRRAFLSSPQHVGVALLFIFIIHIIIIIILLYNILYILCIIIILLYYIILYYIIILPSVNIIPTEFKN